MQNILKSFLCFIILISFISCVEQSNQSIEIPMEDSISSSKMADSISSVIEDSIKIDSIKVIQIKNSKDIPQQDSIIKEDYKKTSKNKLRTLKIHTLKDSVNLINFKLDHINECLKKWKSKR